MYRHPSRKIYLAWTTWTTPMHEQRFRDEEKHSDIRVSGINVSWVTKDTRSLVQRR